MKGKGGRGEGMVGMGSEKERGREGGIWTWL